MMKPPICCICRSPLGPEGEGDLVSFAKSAEDEAWDRMAEAGLTGHPPYADWFCSRHVEAARRLTGRSLAQATALIRDSEG